jgi:hypothetical protein
VPTIVAASPVHEPFTFAHQRWCPSYQVIWPGRCGADEHSYQYTVRFSPRQVRRTRPGYIDLAGNRAGPASGACPTDGHEAWSPLGGRGRSLAEVIDIPCDSRGHPLDWPAFWLLGREGGWPAEGEIDVVEGSGRHLDWHFHYANAQGQPASVNGHVGGDWCGVHRFGVFFYVDPRHRYALNRVNRIGIWWGPAHGRMRRVGRVTSARIGVPIPSSPYYVLNDLGASPYWKVTPGVTMQIRSFSHT